MPVKVVVVCCFFVIRLPEKLSPGDGLITYEFMHISIVYIVYKYMTL